ncbi:xylose isomerase, partial [Bacillus cereus]
MKLGVFTTLFSHMEFEEMLDYVQAAGLHAVEIGTGCYPGGSHCNLDLLLESEQVR